MIVLENECVGCPKEMGCLGGICPNRNVPHYYCDICEDETELYHYNDSMLCEECAKLSIIADEEICTDEAQEIFEKLKRVEGSY